MTDHNHLKIHLIKCVYDLNKRLFNSRIFIFCNYCYEKLEEPKYSFSDKNIPEINDGLITKVICSVRTNGYEYRWFGHDEDWDLYFERGDRWE